MRERRRARWESPLDRGREPASPRCASTASSARASTGTRPSEALAPRCRAMAFTLPIFGTPPDELSVMGLRAYVEAFMDAERVPPAIVVGNSLGGHVALDLALRAPERVRGLVLSGSSGLFERGFTRGVPHRPSAEFVREKMAEVFHDPAMVTPERVEEVRHCVNRRSYVMRVLQVSRSAKGYNLEDRLGEIQCPTLLVWGTEDRVTPRDVAIRFLEGIPSATIRLCARMRARAHARAILRRSHAPSRSFSTPSPRRPPPSREPPRAARPPPRLARRPPPSPDGGGLARSPPRPGTRAPRAGQPRPRHSVGARARVPRHPRGGRLPAPGPADDLPRRTPPRRAHHPRGARRPRPAGRANTAGDFGTTAATRTSRSRGGTPRHRRSGMTP